MKLLLATYWPLPHVGGVSTYVDTLSKRLIQMGHEVEIFAQHPDLTKFYLMKSGHEIFKNDLRETVDTQVKEGYILRGMTLTPWMFQREVEKYTLETALRTLKLNNFDLIHTQDILSTFTFARVKLANIPLVATIHGCLSTEWVANGEIHTRTPIERDYLHLEEYFGAMSPDHLILPSRWLADRLFEFQVAHPRKHIIPYGLDLTKFRQNSQRTVDVPVAPNKKVIVCPARLVAIKGQTYLLQALSQVVKHRQDIVCWFVGDGMMRQDLEDQASQLQLEGFVHFLGDRSDVPALLSRADIVVLPSLQDNLPFVVMEAQTAGKPVIATKVGGNVEMIEDGKTGILVEPKNSKELSEKILFLLDNDKLHAQQSIAAKSWADEQWNDDWLLERTLSVYRAALQQASEERELIHKNTLNRQVPDRSFATKLLNSQTNSIDHYSSGPVALTIEGSVKPRNEILIPADVYVHLLDVTGIVLETVQTNSNGQFSFENVQPGTYAIQCVTAEGQTGFKRVIVPSNELSVIEIHV